MFKSRLRRFHHLPLFAVVAAAILLATLAPADVLACTNSTVTGSSNTADAVDGTTCVAGSYGVFGTNSAGGTGVLGEATGSTTNGIGVEGYVDGTVAYGVYGANVHTTGAGYGVYGTTASASGYGVVGANTSTGVGIYGTGNTGVEGKTAANSGSGVYGVDGSTSGGYGVFGTSSVAGGHGGLFQNTASSGTAIGVYGYTNSSTGNYGGYFYGNVHVIGNLSATGTKPFVQQHPTDPTKEIVFVSLEGPEVGTYCRGTAKFDHGVAHVSLPESFTLVTENDGVTATVTAVGKGRGLYVESRTKGELVVACDEGSACPKQFDWLVNGIRAGYSNHVAIRPRRAPVLPQAIASR